MTPLAPKPSPPHDSARARVKGTLLITLVKFIRSRGMSPDAVIATLPAADQAALREILLPSGWYSADLFARFVEAVAAASGSSQCVVEMGRFSAQTNLGPGGLRRAYVREDDPHHVLAAISRIYKNVYTLGERGYERLGEKSAMVYGRGTVVARDHCSWFAGWLERVVELSGGREVRVTEERCERTRAPRCEYRVDWS